MELSLRKTCCALLTRLINGADDLLKEEDIDVSEINILIARVKAAKGNLSDANEKVLAKMNENDLNEDQLQAEFEKCLEYNDAAVMCIAKLEQRLQSDRGHGTHDAVQAERALISMKRKTVRLPKLELVKFNGNPQDWQQFWEQFSLNIHNNDELDDSAKFSYLKSALIGRAADTINGLLSSQSCYKDAIELLKQEFGDVERIVDSYIQQLLMLPSIKNKNDVLALRKLYNAASTICRSLHSQGVSSEQYGMTFKSIVLKALPYSMRIEFNKKCKSDIPQTPSSFMLEKGTKRNSEIEYEEQITKILHFLKLEIESVEEAKRMDGCDRKVHSINAFGRNNKIYTAAELLTGTVENKKESCLFCHSKDHLTQKCDSTISLTEKKDILKQNSRCFRCTKRNHSARFCRKNVRCSKCNGRHVTAVCDPNYPNRTSSGYRLTEQPSAMKQEGVNHTQTTNLFADGNLLDVYLQTACAFISPTSTTDVFIRLVIDSGSQLTFIKESLSRKLDLPVIGTRRIAILAFGNSESSPGRLCRRVLVKLKSQHTNEVVCMEAVEIEEICLDSLKTPKITDPVIKDFAKDYQLADVNKERIEISGLSMLIGADNYWKIVKEETKRLSNTLSAINTVIGWTLLGSNHHVFSEQTFVSFGVCHTFHVQNQSEIDLKEFWDLERIGIKSDEDSSVEKTTLQFMEENIEFRGGRYSVKLPWLNTSAQLDSNYSGALSRVTSLTRKLTRNGKLQEYDFAMREYLRNDCAEIAASSKSDRIYYMPHRAVYREDKETTKIRIVFDASAHSPGYPSLNDMLSSGENIVPELLRVLLNFRIGKVGLIADIEKAFLQISLDEDERDTHRFLWYEQPVDDENVLPKLISYRMKRVTFGVTCSPFLLAATLHKHLLNQDKSDRELCDVLRQSFYVDDLVISADDEESGAHIFKVATRVMRNANMNLRKWYTNNKGLSKLCEHEHGKSDVRKVLGLQWFLNTDEIAVDLKTILYNSESKNLTKRYILQTISMVYDPLGFLGPFTVRMKILLQEIWKARIGWDDTLPESLASEWVKWRSELMRLDQLAVPRCALLFPRKLVELHIFADASPRAYGAVAYIKTISSKESSCEILMSKNRIAPINDNGKDSLTLPKLELTAALCAARLQNYIIKNFRVIFDRLYLWSDSKITLYWIYGNPNKWKQYVRNRVMEINTLSKGEWRHCPGSENPADMLTRGVKITILIESEVWRNGPQWLSGDEKYWPTDDSKGVENEDAISTLLNVTDTTEVYGEPVFRIENYSSLERILRITAYVFRIIRNLKAVNGKETGYLSKQELCNAENYWIKLTQQQKFKKELQGLKQNGNKDRSSSLLMLNPFIDDKGIIRLGGRLEFSDLPYETKHPIILPKNSCLGDRLVWSAHIRTCHGGIGITLAEIRKRFWIIQGRQRIKSILRKCVMCQKLRGKSAHEPFAPLPKERLCAVSPFKISGIDFAGPLFVKKGDTNREKVYIMLITCAIVRAVHLELVPNLSTEGCLLALRRFFARRGVPDVIYSDNAKTFKRAALEFKELKKLLNERKIQDLTTSLKIKWKFSCESAPWWGGFWKRLVRSVKTCLKSTLGKSCLNYDELMTVLTEVEAIVNSRPLTYIDDDTENLLILTPSHFLVGHNYNEFDVDLEKQPANRNEILKLWKIRLNTGKRFWKFWLTDYLQSLRSAHLGNQERSRSIKVDDVVIIQDENLPRQLWKMAKVVKTFPGRDGRVRSCEVRTASRTVLRRPVQRLIPLELLHAGEDVKN